MGKVIETVADSIAIKILNTNLIIQGKGNELHLHKRNAVKENVFDTEVLDVKLKNKVHGIKNAKTNKLLLVYGEKEFVLLQYKDNIEFLEVYRAELSDWISCGLILEESNTIVLLTAHSSILRFSYQAANGNCCLEQRISCTDKSTLYCAHLYGDKWTELVVFAGNAFGELLIWQPSKNEENIQGELKLKVSPLLHRISAHNGVIFSIDFDQLSQYLITTSDDRSIKWWKLEHLNENNWSESTFQPLCSGYGHVARVFRGRIIKDGSNIYALSVGEDSYICLWDKNAQLLFKRRQQYGATIWNFVYEINNKTIYTVGALGNLVAFGLKQILQVTQKQQDQLLPSLADGSSMEYIAKVKFLTAKHLIGVTNLNNLMISVLKTDKWLDWEIVPVKVDFKCTVLETFQNLVAICGYKRLLLLEHQENTIKLKVLYDTKIAEGIIRTFVFFSKQRYIVSDDRGNCLVFLGAFNNKLCLELPKSKEPWLTTAMLLNRDQHIVISNRQGNLMLYQLDQYTNRYELKHTVKHPHGNLGATNIQCIKETPSTALIRSSGHDGALNVFSVDFIQSTLQTCNRQIIPVSWVEHIVKWYNDFDVFLGFNDNHFVAWCKEYDFLLQLPCGGGHRCWHFVINRRDFRISLGFIKNKRVHFYEMPLLNKELTILPLAKRWHIAPCNVMQILRETLSSSAIAVTAGDDNLLKVHTINRQTGFREQKEMHHHISNIRALSIFYINDDEFLIFSGGGRAQLCVTKVNSNDFHVKELINYTLKQVKIIKPQDISFNFDPETRLMCLDVKIVNQHLFDVYVGCSDGCIRHLQVNLETCKTEIITEYVYGKCILQLKYIQENDSILVGATDGLLTFYDSTLSKCLYQLQHHSSGINSLSVSYSPSNKSLLILSGGDDQAVSYTELSLINLEFQVLRKFQKPYLHTAQVCACAISSNGLYGFTSGVDQVLNKLDLSTGEVVDSFYSCVADIKGVALLDDDICFLYGCGLQIYSFNA